jgi:hypothetical protein
MSALSIQPTYPIFTDIDGQPLEDGYVWIGVANLQPIGNPINVYWDAALTLPAVQPIRTRGGYPVNSGTPARLYVNSDYSIQVQNKNGSVLYSAPTTTERYSDLVISGINAEDVVYNPPFSGSVQTNVEVKLSESVSVFDFMTAAQIADVQARTYVIDVSTAISTAIASGAKTIIFPDGGYRVNSGFVITSTTPARQFIGQGEPTIKLFTAVQASIFEVQPGNQFLYFKNLRLDSNGSKNDGLQTYGILTVNNAYSFYDDIRCTNFSGAGMEHRQCVYLIVNNYTCNNCFYGLSWQKYLGVQCTAATVNSAYISGCTRGLTQTDAVAMQYNQIILEYCGDAVTADAAFHIDGGACQASYLYCEANNRNILIDDSIVDFLNKYIFAATAPDIITYFGIPFSNRGVVQVLPYEIQTPRLKPDSLTNRDLTIGTNLVAPIAGGSVKWGETTTERVAGAVPSGVWTTVYTVSGQSGDGAARKGYRYAVYAGRADLTTGYDTGVILNGVLYSDSGVNPAWLQLSGNNIQLNITNASYGLDYGLSLMITNGIGAP